MNFIDIIVYQPLFNILVALYDYLPGHDLGIAIIILALLIRLVLHPLTVDFVRTQKVTAIIQPKIKEIQEKYKDDKEKQALLMMQIWKDNKINLFSGFILIAVQIAIIFPLYRILGDKFKPETFSALYNFIPNPGTVSLMFLGSIDLTNPYPLFAILAGIFQYYQTKMVTPKNPPKDPAKNDRSTQFASMMQTQSLYVFPIITVMIFWTFPGVISLYWATAGAFSLIQQYIILKKFENIATN